MTPGVSSRFWARFRRHKLATHGGLVLLAVTVVCFSAPVVAPYAFDRIDLTRIQQAPSWAHWMGTDDLGRDLLTRVLYGGQISIAIGLISALLGTALGTLVGLSAGFFGGSTDGLLMRATDVVRSIPTLPLVILIGSFAEAGVLSLAVIIGLLTWTSTARVVRGEVLSIKERGFVEAARSLGASDLRLVVIHILPNALGPVIVGATLAVGNAIILESTLSFLGLGVRPPVPTWGNMLMEAQATMATGPWLTMFPGTAILLVVLSVNFLGDGLRDAMDPSGGGEAT